MLSKIKTFIAPLKTFRIRITVTLVLAMFFSGAISNLLIYEFALRSQFEQLRNEIMVFAETAAMTIDAEKIKEIPLNKNGVDTPAYREITRDLLKIRLLSPSITYVYTMARTGRDDLVQFIVDPPVRKEKSACPGEIYDASGFPAMRKAFHGPSADTKLGKDKWGVFLSGYAPIKDKNKHVVAILGVDIKADHIYVLQNNVRTSSFFVFILGVLISIFLGTLISNRITEPVKKLVEGTRRIARGDLNYRVDIKGADEISELAASFSKMSQDLNLYIEELKRTTAEKERLLRELEIAREIQQGFLPLSAPDLKIFDIAATSVPAKQVGGDFYDFIPIDKDKWGIVVGDVSGKGVPAALFMALSRTLVRASTLGNPSVSGAIKKANALLVEDSRSNLFVTLFYGILDLKEHTLKYVNAGHNPPVVLGDPSTGIFLLKAQGIPLGISDNLDLEEQVIKLDKDQVIGLYTDGVTEAVGRDGTQFGIERMEKVIQEYASFPAENIMSHIQKELNVFVGDMPQFDDITLMIIKVT